MDQDHKAETAEPATSITSSDLDRLGPPLFEWLRQFLHFADGRFWGPGARKECLKSIRLSERQRVRAEDALSRGASFWDRIGHNVLVPLSTHSAPLGMFTLSGVKRSIGPEEGGRWLPLLGSLVEDRLRLLKIETVLSAAGQPPRYLLLCLDDLHRRGKDEGTAVVHIAWDRGGKAALKTSRPYPGRTLVDFCTDLWPGRTVEWMGGSMEDAWIMLAGTDEALLASGMKHLISKGRKGGLNISGAHGCAFRSDWDPRRVVEAIRETLDAAAELGAAVFSYHDLLYLQDRTGINGLGGCLCRARTALVGKRNVALAFGRPITTTLGNRLREECSFMSAGEDSGFLLMQIAARPASFEPSEWAVRIQDLAASTEGGPTTLGVASTRKPGITNSRVVVSALMAYIHASLLGQGSTAVFDALTCNVSGDEFSSWGDLSAACRHYRSGLKLAPRDANLLNSLGVCLAELGKVKEAVSSFSEATVSSPDDFMAYYNLGGVFREIGELDRAQEALTRAFELRPDDIRVAIRLAETLIEAGRATEAASILSPLTERDVKNLPGFFFRILGRAYWSQGAWPEARDAWHEALRRNPSDPESLALLAVGYLEKAGDKETAARLSRQAKALVGGDNGRATAIITRLEDVG